MVDGLLENLELYLLVRSGYGENFGVSCDSGCNMVGMTWRTCCVVPVELFRAFGLDLENNNRGVSRPLAFSHDATPPTSVVTGSKLCSGRVKWCLH
jgi:hypothetical protein